MFSEFSEFSNPESADYDIKSSLNKEESIAKKNKEESIAKKNKEKILRAIVDLVGFLEDDEWLQYGITEEEYFNPTIDTLRKIKESLNTDKSNTR